MAIRSHSVAATTSLRLVVGALLLSTLAACAGRNGNGLDREAEALQLGEPVAYEVRIEGPLDADLEAFLLAVSEAEAGTATPPRSVLALRRRATTDADRLSAALASRGHFDGAVSASLMAAADRPDTDLALVTFEVTPGDVYTLAEISIEAPQAPPDFVPPAPRTLGLVRGAPALADTVLDGEAALLEAVLEAGRAYAQLGERTVVIDRDTKTMDVVLRIDPGPVVTLDAPAFVGAEGIDERFLRRYVPWQDGQRFAPDLFRDTRRNLVGTRLFRTIRVDLPPEPPAEGPVPVTIVGEQRLHRTISAAIRFQTDGGPGGNVAWEHRNLLGAAERLRVEADADLLQQTLDARFRKPDVLGLDSAFLLEGGFARRDTDAFESLEASVSAGLEYRFTPHLTGTAALRLSLSEITDTLDREEFGLLSVPGVLRFDNTDEPLDPARGVRWRAEATPFWDMVDTSLSFQRFRLDGSTYLRLSETPRLIFAVRGAVGSIVGAERDTVPATERFYAGGGGSIRGIPFQTAGPLDQRDDPLGGRSLVEFSTELRYQATDTIGAVLFLDGGNAFEASWPDFDGGLEFGAGAGLRYNTPIGPLRLDVAVPIDRRSVDDAFQIYISLGQAF
ncbi:MAG: outer membrane protein assembly factor [Geminicoccaceae bacterium]|nr:MAG: outer membrane protein assembly factor [Geminicoccaceae bacterium]